MVASEPDQVVVSGDYPKLVEFVPVDGVFVPDPAVITVGILDHLRCEHVIVDSRNHIITNNIDELCLIPVCETLIESSLFVNKQGSVDHRVQGYVVYRVHHSQILKTTGQSQAGRPFVIERGMVDNWPVALGPRWAGNLKED